MTIVLIAVNEDGLGPSSMMFHLVLALLCRRPDIAIVLRTGTKAEFNERLYADILSPVPAPGRVYIERVHNLIQLTNQGDGGIDVVASLDSICRYPIAREAYLRQTLHGAAFAIECGVPTLARACRDAGIRCYTVFDHSWALTFRSIAQNYASNLHNLFTVHPSRRLELALTTLEADEAATDKVFLFDPPLTPSAYRHHWERLCPGRIASVGGLFGGPAPGEEEEFRRAARHILNLSDNDRPVLLVSGGGTGVWAQRLPSVIADYAKLDLDGGLDMHLFVFAGLDVEQALAQQLEIGPEEGYDHDGRSVAFRRVLGYGSRRIADPRVRLLRGARRCTYQQIIAGVDFVLTRAGMVTIMDALATRVSTLLVPQPGHAQVEDVHRATVEAGVAFGLPFEDVWKEPLSTIGSVMAYDELWADVRRRMTAWRRNREGAVVEQILEDIP
jgi:hypothetical protein